MSPRSSKGSAPTALFLLEDHVVVRQGLTSLLDAEPDLHVIAQASSLAELEAADAKPDVVVSDLVLGDGRGAAVIEAVRLKFPKAGIVVLSMVDNPADIEEALEAGASGYLLKEAASRELIDAVRTVASGDEYMQPSLGASLARWRHVPAVGQEHVSALDRLTDREREMLRLIALGHTNPEMAKILHVSIRTVETHRASITRKVGARSRADLVAHARRLGLTDPS